MSQSINQVSYGFSQPLVTSAPIPIPAKRAPTTNDLGFVLGQTWIYNGVVYTLVSNSNNTAVWSAGGAVQTAKVILTSQQVKSLYATPIVIIPAQGVGTFINVFNAVAKMTYGGTNVFVAAANQSISLYYNNEAGEPAIETIIINSNISASSNQIGFSSLQADNAGATAFENVPIVALNPQSTEISGNAANNNTITVVVNYQVLTI
jgi:hypothetical protein